jgi:hypothetical protein
MEHKVRPSTFASYEWYSGKYLTPGLGTLQLGSLSAELPQVIAARFGHANTNITMNLYARVIGGADEEAAARVAAATLGQLACVLLMFPSACGDCVDTGLCRACWSPSPRRGSLGLQAGEEPPLPPFVVAGKR